jgi:death-on-curing protein
MLGLEPAIEAEYQRFQGLLGPEDSRLDRDCLTAAEVLRAHFLIANHFYLEGNGLGGIGLRDNGLLHSAIGRQQVSYDGKVKWTNPFDICATLFFGLIKNHAFIDANKRTAFLSALFQLRRIGRCPSVAASEFENLTVDVADDALHKYARYSDLVARGDPDPEVKYISFYLRKNTREIDKKEYAVTYRELQSILHRYGFSLENPHGTHIDVVRVERKRKLFGLAGERIETTWLGQIGFPRWTAEVGKGAMRTVRDVTNLTSKNGVDSASFFHGLDPMQELITFYHAPLMRLAER